jgi:chlorophyll(ide) b reductase
MKCSGRPAPTSDTVGFVSLVHSPSVVCLTPGTASGSHFEQRAARRIADTLTCSSLTFASRQLSRHHSSNRRPHVYAPTAALPSLQPPRDYRLGVVVTGGSKGVGFALAAAFLASGDSVVICSRDSVPGGLSTAVDALNAGTGPSGGRAYGVAADVASPTDVERLAVRARVLLGGRIDCWINNAAQVGKRGNLVDLDPEDIVGVVSTNLLGALLCCREAEKAMRDSGGHVFTVDGAGSGGNATATYVAYGSTKRAVPQMVASLAKELKSGNVRFHVLSPGMVLTDLLLAGNAGDASTLRFFNFLAEEPETVARNLVPRVRAVVLRNSPKSEYVKFLTLPRAFALVAGGFLFGLRANRYFDRNGERVDKLSGNFNENGVRKPW